MFEHGLAGLVIGGMLLFLFYFVKTQIENRRHERRMADWRKRHALSVISDEKKIDRLPNALLKND